MEGIHGIKKVKELYTLQGSFEIKNYNNHHSSKHIKLLKDLDYKNDLCLMNLRTTRAKSGGLKNMIASINQDETRHSHSLIFAEVVFRVSKLVFRCV